MTAWKSPGPVSTAFLEATEAVTVLMGPAGGGKTTTGLMRGVMRSFTWPETRPGLRRVKFGVVRKQMTELERTTIPSWQEWFPRSMGNWRGARGEPQSHELVLTHPADGSRVELEVVFRGVGEQAIDQALRGWEPSYILVDECDTLAAGALAWLFTRAGRFPKETLHKNPKQVFGTCNAPEADNYIMDELVNDPLPGWRLYRQPSGLSAQAENLAALGPDWYPKQAASMPSYQRKRFIENIPGLSLDASAVYEDFNPDFHIAPARLDPIGARPLLIGLDAGGTPAASIWQIAPNGQRRCLAELSTHAKEGGSITGPNRFGEALAQLLADRFRGLRVRALADPSAAWGADTANGEGSWIDIVARVSGLTIMPAPTNDPTIRREALRWPMTQLIDGRHPGLLISPDCTLTLRGLARDYKFAVTGGRKSTTPLKNWASHLIEAGQYALLDGGAFFEVQARQQARSAERTQKAASSNFNPFQ
jgi:hypothetical protein